MTEKSPPNELSNCVAFHAEDSLDVKHDAERRQWDTPAFRDGSSYRLPARAKIETLECLFATSTDTTVNPFSNLVLASSFSAISCKMLIKVQNSNCKRILLLCYISIQIIQTWETSCLEYNLLKFNLEIGLWNISAEGKILAKQRDGSSLKQNENQITI